MSFPDEQDMGPENCGRPCPPEINSDCCADYWARMVSEGFWDADTHRWTALGMREMLK